MQHHMTSDEKHRETVKQTSSATGRNRQNRGPNLHYFARWDREDQLKAFFTWLPTELHDAPGIDWTQLTSDVMGYLIRQFENSADAAVMAVAAASMHGAIDQYSQRTRIKQLGGLLQNLRATTPIRCLADLKQEQIWFDWAAKQEKKEAARQKLTAYAVCSTGYFLRYLRRLPLEERQRMHHYALPPLPVDFFEKCFPYKELTARQKKARKETTDILVPLYPLLRQMVRLRKQLAERTLLAIREACRKVEAGEVSLPYHFEHIDTIPW